MADIHLVRCNFKGTFCEEIIILKCLIYKNSNAMKNFKFFKSIKYCFKQMEKAELISKKSRTEERTVRLKSDILIKLNKAIIYAATTTAKEMRVLDGYLPVILVILACISAIRSKIELVLNGNELVRKEYGCIEKGSLEDFGTVVTTDHLSVVCNEPEYNLFSSLMETRKPQVAQDSSSEEEEIVVVKRRKLD